MKGLRLLFQFVRLLTGTTLLTGALMTPVLGLAAFFSPRFFFIVLVALALAACISVLVFCELGMLRLLHGQLPRTYGLRNSYEMAYAESGRRLSSRPALMTFPDPVPNAFVVRSLGGDGLILLSEGLISILDEAELRFVLRSSIDHLVSGEILLQSACIFALTLIQRASRKMGSGLTPGAAIRELVLFPWRKFFSKLAVESVTSRVGRFGDDRFVRGASKLARAEQLYGQHASLPGLVYLGIQR